jgi:hypothetical protein
MSITDIVQSVCISINSRAPFTLHVYTTLFTNEIEPILTFNISKITKYWSYSNDWKTAHFMPVYKIGPKYNSEK